MSSYTFSEFLRSGSLSEDEFTTEILEEVSNRFNENYNQTMLRRYDTILDSNYTYRNDHLTYPAAKPKFVNIRHFIIMVGLPARGKTYISRKLCRFLNWSGICSKVVNCAEYRRKLAGADLRHDFFSKDNVEASELRHQSLQEALGDGANWLKEDDSHKVLIFDATNTTKARRKLIYDFCQGQGFNPFFIESICDDEEIINNFLKDINQFSPDYVDIDQEEAFVDYKKRIAHYKETYEQICENSDSERHYSYIKTINAGRQYLVNNIDGYLQSQIVYYLMNIHTEKRSLYITVHGECDYNVRQEIGGDTELTEQGRQFARALQDFMTREDLSDLKVWTSSKKGPAETASYIEGSTEVWRALDYLDCGESHGKKFSELAKIFPSIFTDSKGPLDFYWRYPGGESYSDMLSRLEPVIMELERQQNVLIISHRTTVRCLMAYFLDHNPDEVARIRVPLHTVFKLTPYAYGVRVQKAMLDEDGILALT